MLLRIFLVLSLVLFSVPARADIYARPTWDNLLKTLVRYGALDLTDDKILDEYAMITDCDVFRTFSGDDFKWQKARAAFRDSVQLNLTKFPASYAYEDKLALDHYDFQTQMYQFSDKNPLQKVNAFFLLHAAAETCGDIHVNYMPRSFRAVLDESVSLPGLPLTQRSADALLRRMAANGNTERMIYVRFNLHINYVQKLGKNPDVTDSDPVLIQQGSSHDKPVLLNAQVDTIDFFEDEQRHRLLYSYQP